MFYVIMNPATKEYLNEAGALSNFKNAERFNSSADARNVANVYALRVVGPCVEGEEP